MQKAVFYHAGCPVCVGAEQGVVSLLDAAQVDTEIIHLGDRKELIGVAKAAGVKSVPALVIDGQVYHINFGADIQEL